MGVVSRPVPSFSGTSCLLGPGPLPPDLPLPLSSAVLDVWSLAGYFKGEQNEAKKVKLNVVPKSKLLFS